MKTQEHHAIYVPGLNDQNPLNRRLSKLVPFFWKPYNIHGHVLGPHWEEGSSFTPKLQMITDKIDDLVASGHKVSLIGQSGGGSAVLNAFFVRRDVINGVVNVAGRTREGSNVKPTLEVASEYSPAFKESVLLFERQN